MTEQEFKDQFVVQFLANYFSLDMRACDFDGVSYPVRWALRLAENSWKELQEVKGNESN